MHEPWETFRIDVEHIEEEGDCAAAAIRFRAKGVDSGVEVDMRFGMAVRIRDGLAIELVNRHTFDEARCALTATQAAETTERR
jgi:ketosteroid isomerase-like protein